MQVFVTGATGWVGSVIVQDLIAAGHRVTGLARHPDKAAALAAAGATVRLGSLDDLALLRNEAAEADAVVHTAFNHDFSTFAANAAQDARAIDVMGDALAGSVRPLLVTSGIALVAPGRLARETDGPPADPGFPRKSELTARRLRERGVRAATVRLAPSVHGVGDHGFVPMLIRLARDTGVSAYLDDGSNRWAGVHRTDAARVYRLALEHDAVEPAYHAIADEGVAFIHIAEIIGRRLGLPVEPRGREHFGWMAEFAGLDMAASSALTRDWLGWAPTGPALLADIDQRAYFAG